MNSRLRAMLAAVGVLTVSGVGIYLYSPQPATRTMEELKDAGILDLQRVTLTCPERLTKQTKNRIEANQPGLLRPSQGYGYVTRTARCWNPDGGNCIRPSDSLLRVGNEGELIVPSLRSNLTGTDGAVTFDDGGDSDDIDDAWQYQLDGCVVESCQTFDAGLAPDGGLLFGGTFCNSLNRLMLQPAPCMIPNGWGRAADGGWCEEECGGPVDCRFGGPYAESDGGPRWRGFNVGPREYAVGAACVPVACSVVAGDVPQEWL